ncbi:hypothetical protein BH20VER3_BH20VER3_23480 [soil metagenome]
MDRAAFTAEARANFFQDPTRLLQDAPEAVGLLRVVGAMDGIAIEPDWLGNLVRQTSGCRLSAKIRLALAPWINHSWHVTLYLTSRGLTTSPIPHGFPTFEIQFDFLGHELRIFKSDGAARLLPLKPQPVAEFYDAVMSALNEMELSVQIDSRRARRAKIGRDPVLKEGEEQPVSSSPGGVYTVGKTVATQPERAYINRSRSPGRYRSGQTGRTVNPLAYAFAGSNPALPTIFLPAVAWFQPGRDWPPGILKARSDLKESTAASAPVEDRSQALKWERAWRWEQAWVSESTLGQGSVSGLASVWVWESGWVSDRSL